MTRPQGLPALATLIWATLWAVAPPAAAQVADVKVELEQFGVGGVFRPGDVTAIRLKLTSSLKEPTSCFVQWEVPNAEGDIGEWGRSITLSAGVPRRLWLYAPLPPTVTPQTVWSVRVFEERDGKRRRELERGARIQPPAPSLVPIERGIIAVVGNNKMHLTDYHTPGGWGRPNPPGAHEETRIVSGITPRELPDRWEGLKSFEAVVWSGAPPPALENQAQALREYVRRGGHLILILPQAGNPWGLGMVGQTYLDDLLPQQVPRTDEGVHLRELMPILSKHDVPLQDIEMSIRVFKVIGGGFNATDNHYEPLLALADGRVVAIQRTVGFGRITLIGIELSAQLLSMGLPEADVFWNRVLGRRSDTVRPGQLQAMMTAEPRKLVRGNAGTIREVTIGDGRLFEETLNKSSQAQLGLLAAAVGFAAYLLLAGPGGFFLLKQRGLVRHSWLAFAATAAIFTAMAWGSVRLLGPKSTEVRHVTFLDHVARPADDPRYDEPLLQRAASWFALYVPGYGTTRVSIESEPKLRDLLVTWAAPEKVAERFPNVDRYPVDLGRSPADYEIPARATATQFYAHWMGPLDPKWGSMIRVDPNDPIRVETDPRTGRPRLAGSLIHGLPGPLTKVIVIWIGNKRGRPPRLATIGNQELPWTTPGPPAGRAMLNSGSMWVRDAQLGPWYPGAGNTYSIAGPPRDTKELADSIFLRYVQEEQRSDRIPRGGVSNRMRPLDVGRRTKFMEMLSIYHHLTPPKYHRMGKVDPETVVFGRQLGRELDLSGWLTRPCVIVIGHLADTPTPIPLRVDGKPPATVKSLTVVRWIHPLPPDEKQLRAAEAGEVE